MQLAKFAIMTILIAGMKTLSSKLEIWRYLVDLAQSISIKVRKYVFLPQIISYYTFKRLQLVRLNSQQFIQWIVAIHR